MGRRVLIAALVLVMLLAMGMAWNSQRRLKALESELVRRQDQSQEQASDARLASRQAQEVAREAAARTALLEAKVHETSLQRSQVEELMQSLSRSRDENVVADVEATLRVAQQHSAITGSVEPLLLALKQADERLARINQPRLERVRRALARDIDRTRALAVTDLHSLLVRLDEATRLVDDLPLLAAPVPRQTLAPTTVKPTPVTVPTEGLWWERAWEFGRRAASAMAQEARGLVRVTRVEHPEVMWMPPEQAWMLRENLKLRLLNARLSLLSRQYDLAQSDLRQALAALDRYFERDARRVVAAAELLRQVSTQARQVVIPRPDETLAALATVAAGR